MKNVAITFLHADLRVQVTSLKRVIRRLLKREEGSEGGTNPDSHAWMYVFLYMHIDTYLNNRLLQEEMGCCSARVPSPWQMREEPQFKTSTKLEKKEQDAQIAPGKSYLDAISRFSQCKLTLYRVWSSFSAPLPPPIPRGSILFRVFLPRSGFLCSARPAREGVWRDLGVAAARSAPAERPAEQGPPPGTRGGGGLSGSSLRPPQCYPPNSWQAARYCFRSRMAGLNLERGGGNKCKEMMNNVNFWL